MPTGNTTLLGLALPVEGELDGEWGDVVNNSITSLLDSAVAGTTTLSVDADVELTTTVLAANQARQAILRWTASNGATTRNITAPAQSKAYIVINAGTGSVVLRGAGSPPTTGITIVSGEKCLAVWNGSDFIKISTTATGSVTSVGGTGTVNGISLSGTVTSTGNLTLGGALTGVNLTSQVTGILPVANGGTATATPSLVAGSNVTITGTWPNQTVSTTGAGAGTVTSVGLSMPSGFSVANSPVTGAGTLAVTTTLNGVLKGTGSAFTAATAGTDYVAPGTFTLFTATQKFNGTASEIATVLANAAEVTKVSALTNNDNPSAYFDSGSVTYWTVANTANWSQNLAFSVSASLNTAMTVGQSMTMAVLSTNGATAYYPTAVTVDGTSSGVTVRWQGGAAPTSGNANSVDIYTYTVIKTADATFSVFAAQTKFA
jgi:hypothetical protein